MKRPYKRRIDYSGVDATTYRVPRKPIDSSKRTVWDLWRRIVNKVQGGHPALAKYGEPSLIDYRWHDFEQFFADVGVYQEGCALSRLDKSKPWGPDNFAWVTRGKQGTSEGQRKQAMSILIKVRQGEKLGDIRRELGVPYSRVYDIATGRAWRHLADELDAEEDLL